jgi:predicted outer membrane repeat protein
MLADLATHGVIAMMTRRSRLRSVPRLTNLEARVNCANIVVTNTNDYDPAHYNPNDDSTFSKGSFRYALQQAHDDYNSPAGNIDVITFNTDPLPGKTNFSTAQTINLNFGQLTIDRPVIIDAPKTNMPLMGYDYVTIHWNASPYTDPLDPDPIKAAKYGTDWSVINVSNASSSLIGVSLRGLKITGGQATNGAGILSGGSVSLSIDHCDISSNLAQEVTERESASHGAAICAGISQGHINTNVFGAGVNISNSFIYGNKTAENDTAPHAFTDFGGGIYVGQDLSLSMGSSILSGNSTENVAGGIYFAGGEAFDSPVNGIPRVQTTRLTIGGCTISDNSAVSPTGGGGIAGGVMIAGPTGGMISDTTFSANTAGNSGGAIYMTGSAGNTIAGVPYLNLLGQVNVVACTFVGNMAAGPMVVDGHAVVVETGSGGAIHMEGVVNELYLVNSTFSANIAGYNGGFGKGGAIAFLGSNLYYDHKTIFNTNYDARTMMLVLDQSDPPPGPVFFEHSHLQIANCTIADNSSNGAVDEFLVLQGGCGGGLAVLVGSQGNYEGDEIISSTIIAKNQVTGGFGPDVWAANAAPGASATGQKNLIGITDSGNFSVPLAKNSSNVALGGTLAALLDPLLHSLADNGGYADTYAIDHTSPAYNTGANTFDTGTSTISLMYDQRGPLLIDQTLDAGLLRVDAVNNLPDIGAYELQPAKLVSIMTFAENPYSIIMSHSRANSMVVTFNQPVSLPTNLADAFALRQFYDGQNNVDLPVTFGSASVGMNNMAVRFTFTGSLTETDDPVYKSLIDGKYQLTVHEDKAKVDIFNFDGNYDGVDGDSYLSPTSSTEPNFIYRRFGDVISDLAVATNDFALFRPLFQVTGVPNNDFFNRYITQFDFNGDGNVGTSDFAQFRIRFLVSW